jgi:hypothetical protein
MGRQQYGLPQIKVCRGCEGLLRNHGKDLYYNTNNVTPGIRFAFFWGYNHAFQLYLSFFKSLSTRKKSAQIYSSTRSEEGQTNMGSRITFGCNQAAEFDCTEPITKMTPLPSAVVEERFPNHKVENVEEEGVSRETARNASVLAEWDDDFDSYAGNSRNKRKKSRKERRQSCMFPSE